ncbi:MAG: hypothetical protein HQL17_06360 [Candidatus Omnitrophica bacterium]|nr:hypothetical protein [Candidatus Omnitrophota bacterium]
MTKHDRLFMAIMLCSLFLLGSIITDNISTAGLSSADTLKPGEARQKIMDMKLPLHEGKYWKSAP